MRQSAAESKDWTSCPAKRRLDIKLVGIYAPDGSTSSRSQDDGSSELIGDRRLVVVVLTETWNRSPSPGDTAVDCDRLPSTAIDSVDCCMPRTDDKASQPATSSSDHICAGSSLLSRRVASSLLMTSNVQS